MATVRRGKRRVAGRFIIATEVERDLYDELKDRAAREERTISVLLRKALTQFLARQHEGERHVA